MFQGLNDWKIIQTNATTSYERDTETIKRSILRRHQSHMSSLIKIGDTAAYNVDDENADGFYIVKWDTEPYVDDTTGQLMCDAHYYDNPPRCRSVYCLVDLPVTVRVQHVMATNIVMEKITDTKKLPKMHKTRNNSFLTVRLLSVQLIWKTYIMKFDAEPI